MPGPIIGNQGFDNPPEEMRPVIGENAYQYFVMIHTLLFKGRDLDRGVLDEENIVGDLTDTTDHADFIGVAPYQHHGAGNHGELDQASRVSAITPTSVLVQAADATAAYTAIERALLIELKADLNSLSLDVAALATKINQLISALRAADLMA